MLILVYLAGLFTPLAVLAVLFAVAQLRGRGRVESSERDPVPVGRLT